MHFFFKLFFATLVVLSSLARRPKYQRASLFSSLEAGAHGYLLKHESKLKLISQLQGILQGDPPLSASIAQRILRYFNHKK